MQASTSDTSQREAAKDTSTSRESHRIVKGRWRSFRKSSVQKRNVSTLFDSELAAKYADYPLVRDMIINKRIR
jgi:hypothetical protein